jgi:uncharacterized protein YndB with AHSA1/START domain
MPKNAEILVTPLFIERVFDAPRALVWKAWTEPKYISRWWGPKDFTAPFCKIDLRPGGGFHYCMKSPQGKEYWNIGEFVEVDPPKKIISVMFFSDKAGNRLKPSDYGLGEDFPEDMFDVVTFENIGEHKTKLTLQRKHSIDNARKYGVEQGWGESLDKFSETLKQLRSQK